MSDNKTRVFYALARMPRDFSAKDIEGRLYVAKPRDVLAELRQGGQVQRSFRMGNEQFYSVVPESPAPVDGSAARIAPAQKKRKKRTLMARARAMRKLKQLKKQRGE